ncbi:MAG: hypothetical protein NT128_00690, partial [Proteobacteria bacterium]|nr:hypothetical protein [Pseudomonadota bacterium]
PSPTSPAQELKVEKTRNSRCSYIMSYLNNISSNVYGGLQRGLGSVGSTMFSGYLNAVTYVYELAWRGGKSAPAVTEDAASARVFSKEEKDINKASVNEEQTKENVDAAEKKKAVAQNEQSEANGAVAVAKEVVVEKVEKTSAVTEAAVVVEAEKARISKKEEKIAAKKRARKEQAEANKARKKAAEETSQQRPANAKEEFEKKAAETKWTNDSETNDIVKNRKLATAAKKQKEAFSAAQEELIKKMNLLNLKK